MCEYYHARALPIGCPRTRRRTAVFFSSIYLKPIRTLKFRLNSGLPSPDGVNEMEFTDTLTLLFGRMTKEFFSLFFLVIYLVIRSRKNSR